MMPDEMQETAPVTNDTAPPSYVNQAETQVYSIPPPPTHITNVVVQQSPPHTAGRNPLDIAKDYIPAMPMCLAVTLCALNTTSPGLGTFVSAFCCCCCSTSDSQRGRYERFCINICIAWLQVTSAFLLFFGWAWSIWWGVIFIEKSALRKQNQEQQPLLLSTTNHQCSQLPQAPMYQYNSTTARPYIEIRPDEAYGNKNATL